MSANVDPLAASYDRLPYPRNSYHYTHPDRLGVLGLMLGLEPAPANGSRVLELGCASGANLVPLAYALPQATFVGVDFSACQIAEARTFAKALGLTNVELLERNILELEPELGQFDYVIAHGVYSWVADEVREQLLTIISRHLAPQGIAYVSYNTNPGGHLRRIIREMARYHVGRLNQPADAAAQVRSLVRFLSEGTPFRDAAYCLVLRSQLAVLDKMSDAGLIHEVLEVENQAVLFHNFSEEAATAGLQYLTEATFADRARLPLPADVLGKLRQQQGPIGYEQYLDFFNGQSFRRTLLCRAEANLAGDVNLAAVERMWVASAARAKGAKIDVQSSELLEFETQYAERLTLTAPLSKAAWLCLAETYPQAIPLHELAQSAAARIGRQATAADMQQLVSEVLGRFMWGKELVELFRDPPPAARYAGEHPRASAAARYQAQLGWGLTSLTHKMVHGLSDTSRELLPLLDGRHDRTSLAAALASKRPTLSHVALTSQLDAALEELARLGLLHETEI